MALVTSSSLRATAVRRHSAASGRRRGLRALAIGLMTVVVVLTAVAGALAGLGRMFAVSLEARSGIRTIVAVAPQPDRLAWAASPPGGMAERWPVIAEFLSPMAADAAPSPTLASAARTKIPNRVVVLASADRDQLVAPDRSSPADEMFTGSLSTYVPRTYEATVGPVQAPKIAAPDVIPAVRSSAVGTAPPNPLPTPRPKVQLASLGKIDGKPDDDAHAPKTAIYDIAARVVYLPNGDRLEAHSGLGNMMDDARSAPHKNRGVTPPNTYNLTMREALFHGVQALRMTPVGDREMYGRDGILAHTYMLGPSGQSNGCVSFRDYERFLRAYMRGEINRIVVIERLDKLPTMFARNGNFRSASMF